DGTVRLWDLTGKELAVLQGHTDYVESVAFSPDGEKIASASEDGTVRLWDLTGKELAVLQGHTDYVESVAFSPDGEKIASASYDKTVRLWDLTGKELAVLKGHTSFVNSVAFSPDGEKIASASEDRTVRLWIGDWENLLARACNKLRYNSILLEPLTDEDAKNAGEACLNLGDINTPHIKWNNNDKALFQRDRALNIARTGDYNLGSKELKQAFKRNNNIDLNPATPEQDKDGDRVAKELAAPSIVLDGIAKAKKNDIRGAISKRSATRCALFKKAQRLNPNVDLNPRTKRLDKNPEAIAKQVAALSIVTDAIRTADLARGERAKAQINDIKGAISKRSATRCAAQYRFKQLSFWLEEFGEVLALENKLSDDAS
ncbi:MAG: WD40 repeat domain-containing protein, partial [Prochloraceae cyanobacterium]|nr:WD40 repeat domain-containing protein [Prochloraceae cyanobacterium]